MPALSQTHAAHMKQNIPETGDLCADESARWYAVRTRSRFEATTSASFRDKGFTAFLPTYVSRRQWSDRIKELRLPLFPGYVFCRFDASDQYRVLNSPGVVHIVGAGDTPIP